MENRTINNVKQILILKKRSNMFTSEKKILRVKLNGERVNQCSKQQRQRSDSDDPMPISFELSAISKRKVCL
ncbi:hypothetical protein Fmac_002070 [Flemingia macrophylla]|uniref:Uncharacterized protein n=1 Tax=Flemingia macrophylla TaxID=520843 RepID=A0ABD1NIW1_9FABA